MSESVDGYFAPIRWLRRCLRGLLVAVVGERAWLAFRLRQGRLPRNAYYDRLSLLVMRRVLGPDSVAVDVGCHRGDVLADMIATAPQGRFLAFEPLPEMYQQLQQRFAADPRVRLFRLALSDRSGRSSFNHVVSNPAYSGLEKRQYDRPDERDQRIEVATERLDAVVAHEQPGRIALIKLDVEGGEYQVLEGAAQVLQHDRPIILFEHGRGASDCYGTTPEAMWQLLVEQQDMHIYLLNDWLGGQAPLSQQQFVDGFHHGPEYFYLAHPCMAPQRRC